MGLIPNFLIAPSPGFNTAPRLRPLPDRQLINSLVGNREAGERGMACVPGRAAAFRDGVAQALDYAAALDCKLIHLMAGVPPPGVARDTALALYAANLAWAAENALTAGVKLVIEPLNPRDAPGYLLASREQPSSRRSGMTGSACNSTSITARLHREM
jgi:2-dehydrotetronate isomerase